MKLRLLITKRCNRDCPGCCNKDWDLDALPTVRFSNLFEDTYYDYDEVILTGGEPMLDPWHTISVADRLAYTTKRYMYTAKVDDPLAVATVLAHLDGITVTLHDWTDVGPWLQLSKLLYNSVISKGKSLRVNIFEGIDYKWINPNYRSIWLIKDNYKWIKNCPLPDDEEFKKLRGM